MKLWKTWKVDASKLVLLQTGDLFRHRTEYGMIGMLIGRTCHFTQIKLG
jgi:hypothetical protein